MMLSKGQLQEMHYKSSNAYTLRARVLAPLSHWNHIRRYIEREAGHIQCGRLLPFPTSLGTLLRVRS